MKLDEIRTDCKNSLCSIANEGSTEDTREDTRDAAAGCAPNGRPSKKPNKNLIGFVDPGRAEEAARAHMKSGKPTNAHVINQICGTRITDNQLTRLLNGPRLRFHDLSNTSEIIRILRQGSSISKKQLAGAYM